MYTLKIETAGNVFELTHHREEFSVIHVSGLTPPKNGINTSTAGVMDGAVFNSARVEPRNIVITLVLEGNIEASRLKLYRIFPYKIPCTVYFQNGTMDVKIQGYAELVDGDVFSMREQMQISVICPKPFWLDVQPLEAEISRVARRFAFPFSIGSAGVPISEIVDEPAAVIHYRGTVETGFACDVTVGDTGEPTVTRSAQVSRSAEEMMQDVYTNLTTNINQGNWGTVIYPAGASAEFVTRTSDSTPRLCLHFGAPRSAGEILQIVTLWDVQQSLHDLSYYSKSHTITGESVALLFNDVEYFDAAKSCWTLKKDGIEIEKTMFTTSVNGNTVRFDKSAEYPFTAGEYTFEAYSSAGGTDISGDTLTRTVYTAAVESPDFVPYELQNYDTAKDLLRVLANGAEQSDYTTETLTHEDGSAETIWVFPSALKTAVTFEIFKSTQGEDIRNYSDTDIYRAMGYVSGLRLVNRTTRELLEIENILFRSGDRIRISTVPRDLCVTVLASSWMDSGTSLFHAVTAESTYFKLQPGENAVVIQSATNSAAVTAQLTADILYTGV